ncbi:hypothetical protein L2E82_07947 [Cichorium intybus]|uniref:Uncharacterized protein n=1 Tax=Cichorium intybus TaxID=13427 RepID=A0ACB9G4N6_CICIN|nr:hypothetical protein L2E82_07947 [Cichorium intybus]
MGIRNIKEFVESIGDIKIRSNNGILDTKGLTCSEFLSSDSVDDVRSSDSSEISRMVKLGKELGFELRLARES